MDSRRIVFSQTARVAVGEAICVGVMFGIFALLGKWSNAVLLGGLVGGILSVGNFFVMAVGVQMAADKAQAQNVKAGQTVIRFSFLIRYAVLFLVLFLGAKSNLCQPIALVLPLIFVRPVLSVGEYFRKSGGTEK